MSSVDNRVVEMQFDDADFEPGILSAIKALDKLNESLKLNAGDSKGLDVISSTTMTAAKSADGLNYTISRTATSFDVLGLAAMSALNTIVSKATLAGMSIARSLTIDQVSAGFSEYELKMGSIQTILASTGASLDDVNRLLDELNTYADRTIYSFSDMTSNIGKFTNAGVELETAVKAIQGISNEAAVSGANAQEASRAMYNFAQALSAGYVKLIDWKSIENANMATVEFKNELIKTALELGTIRQEGEKYVTVTTDLNGKVSDAFDATSMFNDSLSHQWMTTEVLTATLARYADETTDIGKKAYAAAQDIKTWSQLMDTLKESIGSGWGTTFTLIFGDFEESKQLWTSLSQAIDGVISPISNFRNEMLGVWREMGGREAVINGISNAFGALQNLLTPIVETFNAAFHPERIGERLGELSIRFEKFTASLSDLNFFDPDFWKDNPVEATIGAIEKAVSDLEEDSLETVDENLEGVFTTLFDGFLELKSATEEVHEPFYRLRNIMDGVWYSIKFVVQIFHQFKTVATDIIRKVLDVIWPYVDRAVDFLSFVGECIKNLYDYFFMANELVSLVGDTEEAGKSLSGFELSTGFSKDFKDAATAVLNLFGALKRLKTILGSALAKAISTLLDNVDSIAGNFKKWFDETDPLGTALQFVKDSAEKATEWINKFIEKIEEVGLVQAFAGAVDELKNAFVRLQEQDNLFGYLARGIQAAINFATTFVEKVKEIYTTIKENVVSALEDTGIFDALAKIVEGFQNLDADEFSEGVREFATGIRDLIVNYIGPALIEAFETMKANVTNFFEQDVPGQIATAISEAINFEDFKTQFEENLNGIIDALKESDFGTKITEWLGETWSKISGFFLTNPLFTLLATPIRSIGEFMVNAINGISGPVAKAVGTFGSSVGKAFEGFANEIEADPERALEKGLSALGMAELLSFFNQITTFLGNLNTGFANVAGVIKGIQKMFSGIGNFFSGIGTFLRFGVLLELAGAVLIIAKAVEIIANIPADRLAESVKVIIGILAALSTLMIVIASLAGDSDAGAASEAGDKIGGMVSGLFDKLQNSLRGVNVAALGLAILGVAGAVWIIAQAVDAMAEIVENHNPTTLAASVGLLAGMLLGVVGVLAFFSRGNQGTNIMQTAIGILLVAASLGMLISALSALGDLALNNSDVFDSGIIALTILLGVIAGFVSIIATATKSGVANMAVIGVGLILLAMSMNILITAILALGAMAGDDPSQLFTAIAAISLLMVVMAASIGMIAANAQPQTAAAIVAAGVSMLLLALAMNVLVVAVGQLALIAEQGHDKLWSAVGAMALLAIVMGFVLIACTNLTSGSGSLILTSVAILIFAAALWVLSDALGNLSEIPIDQLGEMLGDIVVTLLALTGIAALATSNPLIALGLLAIAGAFLALGEGVEALGNGFEAIVNGLDALSKLNADSFNGAADALVHLFDALKDIDVLGSAGAVITIGELADGILDLSYSLSQFEIYASDASHDFSMFANAIERFEGNEAQVDTIRDFFTTLGEAAPNIADFAYNAQSTTDFFGAFADALPGFNEGATGFIAIADQFMADLSELSSSLQTFAAASTDSPKAMEDVALSAKRLVDAFKNSLGDAATNLGDSGRALVDSLANGITNSQDVPVLAFALIMQNLATASGTYKDSMRNIGVSIATAFANGVRSCVILCRSAGGALVSQVKAGAEASSKGFAYIGMMMAQGLINGMRNMHSALYSAAYAMGLKAAQGAKDATRVQSPSRVMYEVGRYIAMGLALGITKYSSLAYNASKTMGENVTSSINKALASDSMQGEFMVTPVVDDQSIGSFTASIRTNGMLLGDAVRSAVSAINQNGISTADILTEMQQFRKDLAEYARPEWSVTMGNVDMTNEEGVVNVTRDYVTRLAKLRGGM